MHVHILYYQSNVESLHAIEKLIHCFGKRSVLDALDTIRILITREENDEILALKGFGKHMLSQTYENWFALSWNSWLPEKKRTS